jgi:formamidopyrimidine-DNA glycosylase
VAEVELDSLVSRLGPEAAAEGFTTTYLGAQLARHARAPVKALVLDQSVVAGVGNIYADESLHLARIHPARLAGSLTPAEVKRLHAAIREIMALGIEHGGTSFSNYVNSLGGKGDYLEHARVFRRQGQPCPVHPNTLIEKIRVAGRGTHICPKCQRLAS